MGCMRTSRRLTLAVAAVADGVDQVNDYPGHRRRLLKLIDSHRADLLAADFQPFARQQDLGVRKVDDQPGRSCRGTGSLESGVWLEMISSAGPSASEIIFTDCRTAAGPLGIGGSSGVCARPKLAPSVAASSENRTNWQPIRGKDFTFEERGL